MTKPDISICCLLYNSETTRAGYLSDFFRNLAEIEDCADLPSERVVLFDDRTTDRSIEIARSYCQAESFHFEDYSQAKNLLLDRANGKWVFIAEPDMRYKTGAVADLIGHFDDSDDYKCVEAVQFVPHPDRPPVMNLYYLLIKREPSIRFQGLVFESIRGVFPHEYRRKTVVVGTHYYENLSSRLEHARPFFERELRQLEEAGKTNDPLELYWTALRHSELALMGCADMAKEDGIMVDLFKRVIVLKPDFGPAYFELAKQHLYMDRYDEAMETARIGYAETDYDFCRKILGE